MPAAKSRTFLLTFGLSRLLSKDSIFCPAAHSGVALMQKTGNKHDLWNVPLKVQKVDSFLHPAGNGNE
jgi:hypothetical protein